MFFKGFLQAKGLDERQQYSIKVTRVLEGVEPIEFRALFQHWPDTASLLEPKTPSSSSMNSTSSGSGSGGSTSLSTSTSALAKSFSLTSIAKSSGPTSFDATLLHANPQLASDSQLVDDGAGPKQVWFAQSGELQRLAESYYGEFHSANCYLVHYKYAVNRVDKHILYYWIVRFSFSYINIFGR